MEKNEMLEIVAHDLKNPLTSALTVSGLLSSGEITENPGEFVSLLKKSLHKMNNLVSKMLEIMVLESSSFKTNYSQVDLKQVTEQVISALKIQSDNKNIGIVTDLHEVIAHLDRSLMAQIIDNLLSNAIKFSNHNTTVRVNLTEEKQTIRIEIDDEGPGIKEEEKAVLFQKFQKLHAQPTGDENSTGLGLSIVKKYVEAMKGKVWCESEFGKGATFIVEFPKS